MPKINLQKVDFGQQATDQMWRYVEDNTTYWMSKTKNFRENKLKEFARIYKGKPKNESKDFPWPNASNIVIQVCGTQVDNLLSRVMSTYMIEPVWPCKINGDFDDGDGEQQREAMEKFLGDVGLEPEELDMYRVEEAWAGSTIRNGTGVIKSPWVYDVEQQLVQTDGIETNSKADFKDFVRFNNPRPENVPLNKFLINTDCQNIDSARFIGHIVTVNRTELRNRRKLAPEWFSQDKLNQIENNPDRSTADILQQYVEQSQGLTDGVDSTEHRFSDEYDLVECWIKYVHNGQTFKIVATHHPKSKTRIFAFYNFYPDNMCIFEDSKLAYDDEQYYGYGFAEMLQAYQEEISTMHNQRIDAGTLGNSTAFRINKNSKLNSILTFYPGVLVPADKDEIERLSTSNPQAADVNGENLTLSLAKERTGIDPAMGGTGGGIVNSKRGIYSSQGTFAVLQQQNNRTGLRMSDMRSAHARAGRKFAKMYAHFGLEGKLKKYGANAEILNKAFTSLKEGNLGLLIRPASASLNKELEKQNDILLSQTLERLYASDAQMMQAMGMQGIPDDLKSYYLETMKARNALMTTIVKNFGHDDAARLIPVPDIIKKGDARSGLPTRGSATNQPGSPQSGTFQGNSGALQSQNGDIGTIPIGTGEEFNRVPA